MYVYMCTSTHVKPLNLHLRFLRSKAKASGDRSGARRPHGPSVPRLPPSAPVGGCGPRGGGGGSRRFSVWGLGLGDRV